MRRFLPPVLALFLLAGPAARADTAAAPDKPPEHKITQSKSYLKLDPLYTTIIDGNRARGMLLVDFGLNVPDTRLREKAERLLPVLRDAWLRNLMAFTATHVHMDAQPDVGLIADRLQAVTDRAMGRKGARILLAQVVLRPTVR